MDPILHAKQESVILNEILVLGFNGSFFECLVNYPGNKIPYKIIETENSFLAFQHLETAFAQTPERLPKAVVCEFGALAEENFLLLRDIRNHPELKYLPIITMNRDGLNHKGQALKLGFDDYYDVPVSWQILCDRIQFLTDFKREIDDVVFVDEDRFAVPIHPFKRAFDVIFASLILLAISPILLLTAFLIKLESPGTAIYRSRRVGTGYRVFDFLKFRSMYKDADQRLNDLEHLNQYNGEALFVKFNNDPRVTKTGKFIRKTSIDELPQLFNVLKGDMSVVGNRPLPLYEAEKLTRDHWAKRFLAPAGLTGLWQVSKRGKNTMSTEERIGLDVTYAEHHSFWYDCKIILRTPFALIQEENV